MATRKQYTRFYINSETGKITHVHTQDTPILPGVEPVVAISKDGSKQLPELWYGRRVKYESKHCKKDVVLEMDDDKGHVSASLLRKELVLEDERVCVYCNKPKEHRDFTLRKVVSDGVEVPHTLVRGVK